MDSLEEKIGYHFQTASLLEEALTHPSLAYETQRPQFDNQRLEFLGDAVLQLILTHQLYDLFAQFSEGALTKLRSRLVSRQALTAYARRMGLGAHLRMGKGEEASGGRDRNSTLADAFEALVGAIYMDSGYADCREAVLRMLREDLDAVSLEPVEVNPKGQLQELLQAISTASPHYSIVSQEGPDHCKVFEAKVEWGGSCLGLGFGRSKKEAETAAASAALESETIVSLLQAKTPSLESGVEVSPK